MIRNGRIRYFYDEAGRLIRREVKRLSRKPDIWQYRYNVFDQLTDVLTPDGQWWRYTYDAFGRRISRQHLEPDGNARERTEYIWEKTRLIEQQQGKVFNRWNYFPDSYTPASQSIEQAGSTARSAVVCSNIIGSPTELFDPFSGASIASAVADLWGETAWRGYDMQLRFPGQIYDPETGLHYNQHRYYDPGTGRFLTQDPLGLEPAPNPSNYPHNPLTWIDPLGLRCKKDQIYLYRAVQQKEIEQVAKDRAFGNPRGIESKYFAFTEDGANAYARNAFKNWPDEGPYTIVRTTIDRGSIPGDAVLPHLADEGLGGGVALPTEILSKLGRPRILPYGLTGG